MATTLRGPMFHAADPSTMTADRIRSPRFTTAFRGYDPNEVKVHLDSVAEAYQMLVRTETELRSRLTNNPLHVGDLDDVSSSAVGVVHLDLRTDGVVIVDATQAGPGYPPSSTDGTGELATVTPLYPEAESELADARVRSEAMLNAARSEAHAIVAKANDEAARIILRARAESRGRPTGDGMAVVEAALQESDGDPTLAREQARMMIAEAKAVREKILGDLAKRRRVAHVQLEQMRVAKDRLTETMREARRLIDDASRDLTTAEAEARIAADAAGRRVNSEPMPTAADLEAELLPSRFLAAVPAELSTVEEAPELVILETVAVDAVAVETATVETVAIETLVVVEPVVDIEPEVEVVQIVDLTIADVDTVVAESNSDVVTTNPESMVAALADVDATAPTADATIVSAHVTGVVSELPREITIVAPTHNKNNVDALFAKLRTEPAPARVAVAPSADHPAAKKAKAKSPRSGQKQQVTNVIDLVAYESARVESFNESPSNAIAEPIGPVESEVVAEVSAIGDVAGRAIRDQLVRSLKRALLDEQSSVLSAVRKAKGRADATTLLGTDSVHAGRYRPMVVAAVNELANLRGEPLDERCIETIVGTLTASLRIELVNDLASHSNIDGNVTDLTDLMSAHYRAWTTDRLSELVSPELNV